MTEQIPEMTLAEAMEKITSLESELAKTKASEKLYRRLVKTRKELEEERTPRLMLDVSAETAPYWDRSRHRSLKLTRLGSLVEVGWTEVHGYGRTQRRISVNLAEQGSLLIAWLAAQMLEVGQDR